MAKTFVQLGQLAITLLAIIVILGMQQNEAILNLFKIVVPILGAVMLYTATKGDLWQNKELAVTGLATIVLGITQWFGDIVIQGISIKSIGFMAAVGTLLAILFMVYSKWEIK